MGIRLAHYHIMAGIGLAAGLFVGCQDFLGQQSNSGSTASTSALQQVSLKLAVKDSGACIELQDSLKAAHAALALPATAGRHDSGSGDSARDKEREDGFLSHCVQEVHGADSARPVPPALLPDDTTRCHWIAAQIDSGRDDMRLKLRFYCPDECTQASASDTTVQGQRCRDPKPDCDGLEHGLPAMDKSSDDYGRMQHLIGDLCAEPPAIAPKPNTNGDSLRGNGHDTLPPGGPGHDASHDSLPPKPETHPAGADSVCPDLAHALSITAPGTAGRADLEARFHAACPGPVPAPVPAPGHDSLPPVTEPPHPPVTPVPPVVNCDELRLRLAGMDTASADYAHVKGSLAEHCPAPVSP